MSRRVALLAVALASLFGCQRDAQLGAQVDLLGPHVLGSSLVFLERTRQQAYAFRIPAFEAAVIELDAPIAAHAPRKRRADQRQEWIVINSDRSESGTTGDAQVQLLAECEGKVDVQRAWTLKAGDFDAVWQPADGRFAVLTVHASGELPTSARSTVAVVDLDDDRIDPVTKDIQSLGQPILDVTFSPSDTGPRWAAFRYEHHVSLLRLDQLRNEELKEFFVQRPHIDADEPEFTPLEIAYAGKFIAVRAAASRTLLMLEASDETEPTFRFDVTAVELPGLPLSLIGIDSNERPRFLAGVQRSADDETNSESALSYELVSIDPDTDEHQSMTLDFAPMRLQEIAASRETNGGIIVNDMRTQAASLVVVELDPLSRREVEPLRFPQGLRDVRVLAKDQVVLQFASGGGALLDPEGNEVRSFGAEIPIETAQRAVTSGLWFAAPGSQTLHRAANEDGVVAKLQLAREIETASPLTGSDGKEYLVVTHPSTIGDASLVRVHKGRLEHPVRRRLFLEGVLSGEGP